MLSSADPKIKFFETYGTGEGVRVIFKNDYPRSESRLQAVLANEAAEKARVEQRRDRFRVDATISVVQSGEGEKRNSALFEDTRLSDVKYFELLTRALPQRVTFKNISLKPNAETDAEWPWGEVVSGQTLPQDPNGNLILYVANQSFDEDPVDITVWIDGVKAVESDFYVKDQHNWIMHRFNLAPGRHKLTVKSKKGQASLEKEFEIADKHWAVIDYWYYPTTSRGAGPTPRKFDFLIQDSPIGFE